MWRARSTPPANKAPVRRPPIPVSIAEPTTSVGRPYVMLRVGWQPGRGFILSLTDSTTNEISTPPIPAETLARALEGRCVALRHAGHSVEIAPLDGCVRVKTGPTSGLQIEGTFRPEDLEKAMRTAVERPTQ